jgi:hypothetical protein
MKMKNWFANCHEPCTAQTNTTSVVWNIDKFLKKNGLQKSTFDGNMYYHHQNDKISY